jgi:transposase
VEIYTVELYRKVRLACANGMSRRAAAAHFNISRETVDKALAFSVPPGYRRTAPIKRPKLDGFTGIIDAWLDGDKMVHRKQRHTAKRIFDRLRDEHGFTGGYTIIKDYVRERQRRGQEMFVPLAHPPGHAQADFGEAVVVIDGVEQKAVRRAFAAALRPRSHLTLRHGSASERRVFRSGLPRSDGGGLDGWPCPRLRLLRRRAAIGAL